MAKTPLSIYDLSLSEQAPVQEFKPQQTERAPSGGGSVPANLQSVFDGASQKYQVPVNILLGLAEQESSFNPRALGSETKWGRAKGIMQYLDSTAASMGINPYDAAQSIDAAARQIRERLDKGYSMGEAVKAHFGGDNRKQWGAKTNQYEIDVMRRAEKFLNGIAPGANVNADQPQQAEAAGDTASTTGAPTPLTLEGQENYRRDQLQKIVDQMNSEEADRYSVPTPEQIAAYQQQQQSAEPFKIELPIDVQQQMKDQQSQQQAAQAQQPQGNKDGNFFTDSANALWSGVNSAAENLNELVGRIPGVGPGIVKAIDRADRWLNDGKGTEDIFKDTRAGIEKRWTPEMLAARKKDFVTEDKNGYSFGPAWSDWRSYYSGVVESLPETVMTMGVAGRLAKGAYTGMLAKGATREEAARRAATVATVAGGIIEGGMGGAASARQVRDEIMAMTPQQLQGSEVIRTMMADGMSFEDARKSLAEDSATKAFFIAGVGTGIFGGMGDRALAKIITTPAMGRLKSAAKGAIAEGLLEEMPQSAAQQMAENYAVRGADPTRPLTKGVANAMAQGLAIGGIMGAGMGAAVPHVQESGPLGKAVNEAEPDAALTTAAADAQQRVNEAAQQDQAAAEKAATEEPPAQPTEDQAQAEKPAENWFGEPGVQQIVNAPGIDPFTATVEGYAPNGDVILRDEGGQALQISPGDLTLPETSEAAPNQPETETKPTESAPVEAKSETEPAKTADLPPNVDPETGEIIEPAKAKTIEEMDEPELRDRLRYLRQQAKASGWDSRLTNERRKVEAAIDAKTQQAVSGNEQQPGNAISGAQQSDNATPARPVLEGNEQTGRAGSDAVAGNEQGVRAGIPADNASAGDPALNKDGSRKWFGTERRANEYLAKKGIADTHEVQLVDRQYQIHPKAAQEVAAPDATLDNEGTTGATSEIKPARRKKEPTAEQAPASSPVPGQRVQGRIEGGPKRNRARKIIDAEIGSTVIPRGKVGMMTIGTPYRMTDIEKNGTAHFDNLETGGRITATMAELESARSRSVQFDLAEQPAAKNSAAAPVENAAPAPGRQQEQNQPVRADSVAETASPAREQQQIDAADSQIAANLRDGMKVGELLDTITNGSSSAYNRELARRLKEIIGNADIDVNIAGIGNPKVDSEVRKYLKNADAKFTSFTSRLTGKQLESIYLDRNGKNVEVEALHELVHAATALALRERTPDGQKIDNPALRDAVARVNDLYAQIKPQITDTRYSRLIENTDELLAYGLTDPAFQKMLKGMKVEGQSAWSRFVNIIATVLGVKKSDQSALGEVISAADAVMNNRQDAQAESRTADYGADNKLVSKDRAAELRQRLKAKFSQLNSGIDPEILAIGTELAVFHIEASARKFSAFAKAMAADLDLPISRIRPYLRSWYNGARDMMEDSGVSIAGMDSAETVRAELAKLPTEEPAPQQPVQEQQKETPAPRSDARQTGALDDMVSQFDNEVTPNVPGANGSVERSGEAAGNAVSGVQADNVNDAGRNAGSAEPAGRGADAERRAGQRNQRVSDDGSAVGGERGDQRVYQQNGQFELEGGSTRSAERAGSGSDSRAGSPTERSRAAAVTRNADAPGASDLDKRLTAQKKASGASTTWGDRKSIDAALPLLLPEQRSDVEKIEQRHQQGSGILVTNGTGTGKTATGLGAAKRFYNDGKRNILIVVPTDKIASDWVKFSGMMDMPLHQLKDTGDNGGDGPIVTTYANFAQNSALAQRSWDLVIPDESHYLSSNEAGDATDALKKLRALTGHPDGFITYMQNKHADLYQKLSDARDELNKLQTDSARRDVIKARVDKLAKQWADIEAPARKEWEQRWSQQRDLPKVIFLSATPFAYVKSTDYAEGYLFHHVEPGERYRERSQGGYNSGNSRDAFYMNHFGYRMRYNKLTRPDAEVNTELMEQNFNQWLKDSGALIGRTLDVPHDYDRRFALVDDAAGKKLDDALRYLNEANGGIYRRVYDEVMKTFDYQSRMFLLESMKARAAVPIIKEHLAMGRKVVVFHDYNKGGGFSPFAQALNAIQDPDIKAQAREVFQRPEFQIDFSGLNSALETMGAAFPDALYFNGTVPKAQRRKNADTFNDDNSGKNLIVAQSDAAREGVSLHDTTGKHQRVEINLGMPTRPVAATQIEGRIYRTGQASDAIFRYLTTGTGWEASAFASKIAERASTAENLALGTDARGLKQAFIDAYSDAEPLTASPEDGKGGKARDRAMSASASISPFDKAKTFYFAQQKNTKRRDQREGADYYATPEPVGFKMVDWANIRSGDKVLEPSAGHGAIARFFPAQSDVTMVEPSYDLSQRAALAQGNARIINGTFEDLARTNKYDAIVMNPPYGSGGKTAIEHLEKAAQHLREGGRVVALIPRGGLTDPRLAAFVAGDSAKSLHLVATIKMPWVTFERAGTKVATQVVIFEKHTKMAEGESIQPQHIDLSNAESITDLFNRIENVEVQPRRELTVDQVIANATDGSRYSVADVRSSITDGTLSKPFNALIDNGAVVIHPTVPEGMPTNTQAWTAPDGTINLVADRLTPETAQAVLLHEAFHSGARALVGETRWKNLNDRFDAYLAAAERRSGSTPETAWDKAYARVMHAENSGDTMDLARRREELAAYAIENFERMPSGIRKWVESIVGAVKEFIARRFGKQIGEVTPAQLRALAKEALRSGVPAPRQQPAFSSSSTADLSRQLKADYEGLKLGLTGEGNVVTLSRIVLPDSARNAGTGTEIMQRIAEWADQNGKTVALTPSSDFGGNKGRLTEFYKRFGFIENKGSNRDFEISETMYREPKAADNRYSVGEQRPTDKQTDSWIGQKWDATKELSDAALKTVMPSLLHWTPSRVILTKIGKDIPALREYADTKLKMDTFRDEWHALTDKLAQRWTKYRKSNQQENSELMQIMHDSTLEQVDPTEKFTSQLTPTDREVLREGRNDTDAFKDAAAKAADDKRRQKAYGEIKARFDKLSPEAQAIYKEVRDTYKKLADTQEQIIADNLQKAMEYRVKEAERAFDDEMQAIRDNGLRGEEAKEAVDAAKKRLDNARRRDSWNRKARMTKLRQEFESNRLAGPYFPLSRFGDFFVTARDKATGEVVSFSRVETAREQSRLKKQLTREGYDVEEGIVYKDQNIRKQVPADFVARIEDILKDIPAAKETQDQVWQLYLNNLPDYSLRKNRIHRKGRAGFEEDALRAFASHMFHGAHQTARLKYAMDLGDLIDVAKREAKHTRSPVRSGMVVDQVEKNHAYVMNPTSNRLAQVATQSAFMYFLAQSPAAALVNMSQTWILGVPKLASFYGGNTAKGMTVALAQTNKALMDITRGGFFADKSKSVTADEKAAIEQAYRMGLITRTQSHDVAGIADSGIKYTATRAKLMASLSWMFHHTERVNRETSFLAGYRMARRKGLDQQNAIRKAAELTWDIHFDYQNTSRPRIMHNNTGKALLVFRNYTLNMLADLAYNAYQVINPRNAAERKEARTQLLGVGTMLAFNAGIRGLPLYGLLMMIAGMFSSDGEDPETELKKTLLTYLPRSLVGMMMDGVPGWAAGINLSDRIGFGDLWFRSDDRDREGEDAYNYWLQQTLGASVAIPANWYRGLGQIGDGYYWRGIETIMPKAIKDPMKAYRYYAEGVTTKNGDPIVDDVGGWDIFKQAIGFSPAKVAEQYKINSINMNKQKAILAKRSKLLADYYKADQAGDEKKLEAIEKQMDEYSDKYPEMAIDGKTIKRSMKNREKYRDKSVGGMSYNNNLRDRLLEEQPPSVYR
ncbi:DarB-like antirestriction [Serratia phage Parlo]|uniref:DarB-like antirestriction protein n=1 Tax=Serratia phage Parlo TaxID=2557554 RepID=A0A482MGF6_9CAUD|nr:DarB-like antirestriction [Serratia phage Parlo]QBQ72230.1 DarB-like antirestriction protein [Serratia phage Parlo]